MDNIEPTELKALVQRIIRSGVLGRSNTYAEILNYLLECSSSGNTPKEMAIAIDVLGRDSNFDVANSSIVRVHIYHLRNKLQAYHDKYGEAEKYRIVIPKGQYIINTVLNEKIEEPPARRNITNNELLRRPIILWLSILIALLLSANLLFEVITASDTNTIERNYPGLWQAIFDDQEPVLIVIGDYYIFGELGESNYVSRMVREFNINSPKDLKLAQSQSPDIDSRYLDLNMSYIPTSTAFALVQVMQLLEDNSSRVSVKMMSELTTADLVKKHIIYLGHLSGLGKMEDLLFASSNLYLGLSYDELYNLETNERYISNSGLSTSEESFQDYGMISTFPSPTGHQFIMIAGMRDEGLINISQEATDFESLISLEGKLRSDSSYKGAYEALFKVVGFDNTNFNAELVYSSVLDTDANWEARLTRN